MVTWCIPRTCDPPTLAIGSQVVYAWNTLCNHDLYITYNVIGVISSRNIYQSISYFTCDFVELCGVGINMLQVIWDVGTADKSD